MEAESQRGPGKEAADLKQGRGEGALAVGRGRDLPTGFMESR